MPIKLIYICCVIKNLNLLLTLKQRKMPKLFKTDIQSEADIKVFISDIRSDADIVVYETQSEWEATEAQIWCYSQIQRDADKVVSFVDGAWDADVVIFKTDIQSDAEVVNSSKSDLL